MDKGSETLYLKYLEINGFKSFPDRVKLEFGKGLTAVVGPNGSGKSNISDAVRWVLGEQSSKTLRGDKMEDVIFGGTQLRRPMGFAQVTLTIGNENRDLPIDADEIAISRKLYRSGESEYRINGNAVRLKDVHELFMDTGLGRDGYSMIGQGKIAEIIGAKSTQRREIFEEAAGISKYRYRKTEAERKLAQTQENLLRLKDIMTELENRIAPLKVQSEKAKRFLELAEQRKQIELSLWTAQLAKMTVQLRELDDQQTVGRLEHNRIEEQLQELGRQMEALFSSMQKTGAQIEQIRTEIGGLEEEISSSDSRIAVLYNDISHNERSAQALAEEQKSAADSQEAFARYIAQQEAQKAVLLQKQAQMETKIRALEEESGRYQEQLLQMSKQLAAQKEEESRLAFALSERKMLLVTNQNALADARERNALLEEDKDEKEKKRLSLKRELDECRDFLQTLEETLQSLSNSAKGVQMKLSSRKEKEQALQAEKQSLELKMKEWSQRAALLEELERNMEGFAHSVKYVLSQSRSGAIRGIHGALSSLLRVDAKYLIAVETAVGGALQNIVVDNEAVAKRAIGMLKNSGAGRATFLPLTSVKGRRLNVNGLDRFEGFVGIGSELVEFDETYRGIVESILGRIAVVSDLDEGIRIAKQYGYQFRIVTLDGQLIHTGGSMTGGSTGKSTGLLSRKGEIDTLKKQVAAYREKSGSLDEGLEALRREISQLEAQLTGIEAEQKTALEDQIRYGAEEKRIRTMLEDLQSDQDRSEEQRHKLTEQIKALIRQCEKDAEKLSESEAFLSDFRTELAQLEQKAQAAQQQREQSADVLSGLHMEKMAVGQEIALLEQAMAEQKNRRDDQQKQMASVKEQIESLAQQNRRTREEIEAIERGKIQKQQQIGQLREQIADKTAFRQQVEQQTTSLRQSEKDILVQKEKYAGELLRLEDKKAAVQKEYDAIISKMWDEYETTRSQAESIAQPAEDVNQANRALGEVKGKIRALGTVNLEAIEEYEQVSQRYEFMSEQIGDVERSKTKLQQLIRDLTAQMRELFTDSFEQINRHFSQIFVELFGGGKAQLKLTEGEDVLESGIEIYVQPPGKIIKNLAALSGGEQAFVAIAIYFSILKVRPAPFCLLDEIEAALDDVNVNKYAEYLQRLNQHTQFIAITHRRGTMEHADVLYGVTMQEEGVSKILTLAVSEIENKLGMKNI